MGNDIDISPTTLAMAVIAVLLGLGLGYLAYPAFNGPAPAEGQAVACAMGGEFTLDQAKAAEVQKIFEDIIYLQSGSKHTLKLENYTDRGSFVELNYVIDGVYPQSVYITKDYAYVMQAPAKISDVKSEVDAAIKELEKELEPAEKSDKPSVRLYVMSYCPYGNLAENAFVEVIELMGDKIDFEPVYIISGSGGNYRSLHGTAELNQDIREKIVFSKYGAAKWADFVYDTNKNCTLGNIETCWKEAAERQGISVEDVEAEYAANFNAIADAEVAKTEQAGVTASPTLLMNGKKYSGKPFVAEAYKEWVCGGFNTVPAECNTTLSTSSGTTASGSC
ncbi:MAG: hypothetical protein QXU54_02295 [Candidatus Micrarchaeia archaeon]